MAGMLYVRHMQCTNIKTIYEEKLMLKIIKQLVKYVALVPITILEWIMWPIAKIHAGLNAASQWLKRVGQ